MTKKTPTLEEVQKMSDDQAIKVEEKLVEQTPNQVHPEDGPQPPQDEAPIGEVG